jgi:DNA segregation ATPase FtsK/SpoIIIE, S-DNA-T family
VADDEQLPGQVARIHAERSYEVELDDEPEPGPAIYVDVTSPPGERNPIFPPWMHTIAGIKATARRHAGLRAHQAAWHGVRVPGYTAQALRWAPVGLLLLAAWVLHWWLLQEQRLLRSQAAADGDSREWMKLHKEAKETRKTRGIILAACAAAAVLAVDFAVTYGVPWWLWVLLSSVLLPVLARAGRPVDRPIIGRAVVSPRFRKLNSDIVLRAYYAANLGHPDKPGKQIGFASTMADDAGVGSTVVIDLPYGTTTEDAVQARGKIASGLDVKVQQVYITEDDESNRRHRLWIAYRDPLAVPAGRAPLLDLKPRNIWHPAPFGLDERGAKVTLLLLWISILVGAQPRKGKTYAARLLALYAALDPYVKLTVVDGKDSPDWRKFRLIAHRIIFGTVPGRDGDPVEMLLDGLREIKAHIQAVNRFLSDLPVTECPDGKLTEELSRKYSQLRVWVLVMEEFQVYYELDDQEHNKEIAALLSFIMAVGPSAGVIILSSSQKPSGVGSGDVQRLFNRYRDNHAVRFALKCGNRIVSDAILGGDAYSEGFDASSLPRGKKYRGVGYLYGAADETPTVRTYLADAQDAEAILTAARAHREAAGTLTGMAAGEDVAREARDVLADVLAVLQGEPFASWKVIAARLAERIPEQYAGITAEAISAQLRALKVPSKDGRDGGTGPVLKGAYVAAVEQAAGRRLAVSGGPRG